MADATPLILAPGLMFHSRYEVVRALRSGGMGTVYEVVDVRTRRRRALKVMLPSLASDRDMRARFELEARVTGDVVTDYIVETFDAGVDEDSGAPFLVMELLRGDDLGAILRERGRLDADEVRVLVDQAASALDRTHDAGIVHRDLKPGNLFVTRRDDGTPCLKILDFGIAKLVAQSTASIQTTRSVGTPIYMSPEQVRGDGTIDHRADVYALAHIAYALLVGEPYWEAERRASEAVYPLLMKIAHGAKEAASARAAAHGVTLPEGFDAWFAKATALEPRDRFASAGELSRELSSEGASEEHAIPRDAEPKGPATDLTNTVDPSAEAPPARRRFVALAGAGIAALIAAVAIVAVRGEPKHTEASSAAPSASVAALPAPSVSSDVEPSIAKPENSAPAPSARASAASSPTPTASPAPRVHARSPPPDASTSAPAPSAAPAPRAPLAPIDPSDTR